MTELIVMTPEIRQTTLVVEDMNSRISISGGNYINLVKAAREGSFKPDPPAILGWMPESYQGRFKRFIYNGNTRYLVSGDCGVTLHGLVVDSDDEIPAAENLHFKPAWDQHELYGLLRYALQNVLSKFHTLENPENRNFRSLSLDELLIELMRRESLGFLDPAPSWSRPRLELSQIEQLAALDIFQE